MTTVAANSAVSTNTGTASKVSSLTTASDQEDRFMKLLVAQMKNQDPLNPMDNAQMTSQIAQINTVGGIEKLNTTVSSLLSAFAGMQAQQAVDLVGRDVLVAGTSMTLAGGKAAGGVELAGAADAVTVDILGADGKPVRSIALGKAEAGVHTFGWDGKADDGSTAPDGKYSLRVTATAKGKAVDAKTLAPAHVQAVTPSATGAQLDLGSAGTQPLSAIKSYL
jgi:flagellar basal-body rod modification protein FlgD